MGLPTSSAYSHDLLQGKQFLRHMKRTFPSRISHTQSHLWWELHLGYIWRYSQYCSTNSSLRQGTPSKPSVPQGCTAQENISRSRRELRLACNLREMLNTLLHPLHSNIGPLRYRPNSCLIQMRQTYLPDTRHRQWRRPLRFYIRRDR